VEEELQQLEQLLSGSDLLWSFWTRGAWSYLDHGALCCLHEVFLIVGAGVVLLNIS
jgi:hypothetical protein